MKDSHGRPTGLPSFSSDDSIFRDATMRRTENMIAENLTRYLGGRGQVNPVPVAIPVWVLDVLNRVKRIGMVDNVFDLEAVQAAILIRTGAKKIADWVRDNPVTYVQGMAFGFYAEGWDGNDE